MPQRKSPDKDDAPQVIAQDEFQAFAAAVGTLAVEMRLALISSLLLADTRGGAEAYVEHSARSLASHHDIVVLTGSTAKLEGIPTVRLPSLPILDLSKPPPVRILWHALDQWLPSVHRAVSRELARIQPDIVMTHEIQGLSAAVFTAVARRGLPHVHTAHDMNLLCARVGMTRNGEFCGGRCGGCVIQRTVRRTAIKLDLSRLIGVSKYVCDRHVRAGVITPARAVAIRLGAEAESTTARLRRLDGRGITLGFIGTLAPHKGIRTLLRAIHMAQEPWRLVVGGDGSLSGEVEAASARDPRIEYLGHIVGKEKDAFFDRCDLVVIPSEWEEPATFVAMEAAIRGIPMVVSARGGLMEAPEARSFRSGDANGLLEAIRWYVSEPERLETVSERLLARRTEYAWSTHVSRVEDVLEAVAEESHSRA